MDVARCCTALIRTIKLHFCQSLILHRRKKQQESGKLKFFGGVSGIRCEFFIKGFFNFSAMRKFQSLDRQARIGSSDTTLETIHQNTITGLRLFSSTKLSTSGLDGQLVIWDLHVSGKNWRKLKPKQLFKEKEPRIFFIKMAEGGDIILKVTTHWENNVKRILLECPSCSKGVIYL